MSHMYLYNILLQLISDQIEREGLDHLLEVIDSLGGWPLTTDKWDHSKFNWQRTVGKIIKQLGSMPLITLYVYKDQKNSSRNVLIVSMLCFIFSKHTRN